MLDLGPRPGAEARRDRLETVLGASVRGEGSAPGPLAQVPQLEGYARREQLLKVQASVSLDYQAAFNELFYRDLREHHLLSMETLRDGSQVELVYSVEFKPRVEELAFLGALRNLTSGGKVALLTGQESIDV